MVFNTLAYLTQSYQYTAADMGNQASMPTHEIYSSFACGHVKLDGRMMSTSKATEYQFVQRSCKEPTCTYNEWPDALKYTKPTSSELAKIPAYADELQNLRTKVRANFQLFDALEIPSSAILDFHENASMAKLLTSEDRPIAVEDFFRFGETSVMIEKLIQFGSKASHRPYFDFCDQRARHLLRKANETLAELEESFMKIRAVYSDERKYDPETFYFDHTLGVEELKTLRADGEAGAEILGLTFGLENWHKTEVYLVSKKFERTDPPMVTNLADADTLKPLQEWAQLSQEFFEKQVIRPTDA